MELKLFGKNIFEFKKNDFIEISGRRQLKESKFLPDFYNFSGISQMNPNVTYAFNEADLVVNAEAIIKNKNKRDKNSITPKGVYEAKLLHNESFELKTDPEYLEEKLKEFKDKLNMVKGEDFDMTRGVTEISSLIARLENRKNYGEFESYYSHFPYTGSIKIGTVIKENPNLQIGQVAQFVADMPKEATDTMKEYTEQTEKLCGKKPVFYIIADKKDFRKSENRRDPILLAQSPFGHFWQILGAWDKEMQLLEDL